MGGQKINREPGAFYSPDLNIGMLIAVRFSQQYLCEHNKNKHV